MTGSSSDGTDNERHSNINWRHSQHEQELKNLAEAAAHPQKNEQSRIRFTSDSCMIMPGSAQVGSQPKMIKGKVQEPSRATPWTFLSYVANTYKNIFLTYYYNWTIIITSPFKSLFTVVCYATMVLVLLVFENVLKVYMTYLGGERFFRYMSHKHGQDLSAVNWGTPKLLLSDETTVLVQTTVPKLAERVPEKNDPSKFERTFSLSTAQTLLILAALAYERDGYKASSAFQIYSQATDESLEAGREMLMKSEETIRNIADRWNLSFEGITELNSMGGPFCGIYYSKDQPVIIVAFKGTTPTNYEEFLVDATLQRVDARPYLFGAVHQGFYESLFANSGLCKNQAHGPYHSILAAVNYRAKYIQSRLEIDTPVQVWITGHSLGAAMSSLLFSRWLKCPEDLVGCELRDCYAFGSPAVGDSDFASEFASHNLSPLTRLSTMWRVINNYDVVCRIPIGKNSRSVGPYLGKMDLINYFHAGHAIHLIRRDKLFAKDRVPIKEYPSVYQPALLVDLIPGAWKTLITPSNIRPLQDSYDKSAKAPWWTDSVEYLVTLFGGGDPVRGIERLCPFFIKDHFPSEYFKGLEEVRRYYAEVDPGSYGSDSNLVAYMRPEK